jgi:hypothetical protein
MNPNPDLVEVYGTRDVFMAKTGGELPLVARLSAALFNASQGRREVRSAGEQRAEAELMTRAAEELEKERLRPATAALEHKRAPALIGRGFIDPQAVPIGFDEGMVRLAHASGRALAKKAGIGGAYMGAAIGAGKAMQGFTQKLLPGMKGNLALGGAVLGAGYLGAKALKGGLNLLSHESAPKNYGAGNYQVPFGVNEYGRPQLGTPLN